MTARLNLTGHRPIVEYRSQVDRYFVVFEELQVELAPAFIHKITAGEVALHCRFGTPFFTMIPTVGYGTVYPRPNIIMPPMPEYTVPIRIA